MIANPFRRRREIDHPELIPLQGIPDDLTDHLRRDIGLPERGERRMLAWLGLA